jgi:hypothetical protein
MPASIQEEVGHLLGGALTRDTATRLGCPSRGCGPAARVLGGTSGTSYVCTACGHSWS